jgi:hypothetical protein
VPLVEPSTGDTRVDAQPLDRELSCLVLDLIEQASAHAAALPFWMNEERDDLLPVSCGRSYHIITRHGDETIPFMRERAELRRRKVPDERFETLGWIVFRIGPAHSDRDKQGHLGGIVRDKRPHNDIGWHFGDPVRVNKSNLGRRNN